MGLREADNRILLKNIIISDFETPSENSINKYKLEYIEPYIVGSGYAINDEVIYHRTIGDWFDWLEAKQTNLIVYFHNLRFDGEFILHYLCTNSFIPIEKGKNKDYKDDNTFTMLIDGKTNTIYKIQVRFAETKRTITFKCSYRLLLSSVSALGRTLGSYIKGNIDYDKYYKPFDSLDLVPDDLKKYLDNDIHIVRKCLVELGNNLNADLRLTLGSSAFSMTQWFLGYYKFNKLFGTKSKKGKNNQTYFNVDDYKNMMGGYRGGITVGYEKYSGVTLYNVTCVDVNSMYPSIMEKKELPHGIYTNIKPRKNYVTLYKISVSGYRHDKDLPNLWYNKRGSKYQEKIENEIWWVTDFELETIKKSYTFTQERIMETYYWESKIIFNEVIGIWKEKKQTAINKVERNIWKTLLNSLYGKFGENPERKNKRLVECSDDVKGVTYGDNGNYTMESFSSSGDKCNFLPIAIFVTAYARTILMEAMYENKDNFLYADTDSLWLSGKSKGLTIDETEFGAWKIEHKTIRWKFLRHKMYIYECGRDCPCGDIGIKVRCSGMNAKTKEKFRTGELSWDDFKIGGSWDKGKTVAVKISGGVYLKDVPFSIN